MGVWARRARYSPPSAMPAPEEADVAPPASFETLPEDVLRCVWEHLSLECSEDFNPLCHALVLFTLSRRLRDLSLVVERLRVSRHALDDEATIQLPSTRVGPNKVKYHVATLLAPPGWAVRLANLRELRIYNISWSGGARLLSLLFAWQQLEHLVIGLEYIDGYDENVAQRFGRLQGFADDLAATLSLGALPGLRYLNLVLMDRPRNLGATFDEQFRRFGGFDDSAVLEALPPTAAIWWMAERAKHVRKSKLNQWQYEVEHGADLCAEVDGVNILARMRDLHVSTIHSFAGHRAVHDFLLEHGAPNVSFDQCRFEDVHEDAFPLLNHTGDFGDYEYDTDYEERTGAEP